MWWWKKERRHPSLNDVAYLLCTYDLKYFYYYLLGKYVLCSRWPGHFFDGWKSYPLVAPQEFFELALHHRPLLWERLYIITSYLLKHAAPQIRSFSCKPLPRKGPFCFNAYSHLYLCTAASWLGSSVIADQIQFAISNLENFQVFLIAFCKHSFGY